MRRRIKRHQKSLSIGKSFIIVLTLLILIVISLFYFLLKLEKFRIDKYRSVSEWNTYSNSDYGFSFKYPAVMRVAQFLIDDPENANKKGIRIVMKNYASDLSIFESLQIGPARNTFNIADADGWGMNPCIYKTEKRVGKYITQIITYKQEIPGTGSCDDKYIDFVALINANDPNHPFPIEVELTKLSKENFYRDSVMFDQILASFNFN